MTMSIEADTDFSLPSLLTLRQVTDFLNLKGFPVSYRYLAKLASPLERLSSKFPAEDGRFGQHRLYKKDDVLAWAEARYRHNEVATISPP
jgi:hypothetical protein